MKLHFVFISQLFSCLFMKSVLGGLSGENVCQEEERYLVNVTEFYLRNVTTRTYKWCLQVPPRCSTFSFKTINESRLVEEETTRLVNVCCEGFQLDAQKETCVPETQCQKCMNGVCNEDRKCYCNPGFRGDHCEKACEEGRWGRYCRYHCSCERGTCDPNIGHCYCPAGWTGTKCEVPCQQGRYGEQCLGICNCSDRQICEPQTGRCTSSSSTLTKLRAIDSAKGQNLGGKTPSSKKVDLYVIATQTHKPTTQKNGIKSEVTTTEPTTTLVTRKNMQKSKFPLEDSNLSTKNDGASLSAKSDDTKGTNSASASGAFVTMATSSSSNAEVTAKNEFRQQQRADDALFVEKTTISKVAKTKSTRKEDEIDEKRIFNFASVSFASIVFIAVTGIIIVGHLIRTDKPDLPKDTKEAVEPKKPSIFHSPLPEPPQSPFFDTPLSSHYHKRIGNNEVSISPNTEKERTPASEEVVEIFYDQLPPTNCSTICAKTKDDANCHYAEVHKLKTVALNAENFYDEIPCWTKPSLNEALYMNAQQPNKSENKTEF